MKAVAAFHGRREVRVVDHPEPTLTTPGSVLVRTLEVGVCGTDGELCAFHFGYPPEGEEYLILGHEAVGEIEAVGDAVQGLAEGDLVVPSVRRPCSSPDCPACRTGSQDFCVTGGYTERGIFGAHGFLTERFVEDQRYLYRVPASLREVAVLTEPLTIAEKGLRQLLAVQRRLPWLTDVDDAAILQGRRAVVLGAGTVGVLGAMLLRRRGCAVCVYSREDPSAMRAELVRAVGATYLSAAEVSVEELAEAVGGIEIVYEAAGASRLSLAVVEAMAPNGVFILTGATGGGGRLELGADALLNRMVERNLVLAGTVNASLRDFESAIADLESFDASWPEATRRVVTGRHPMEEFASHARQRTGIKEVIDVARDRSPRAAAAATAADPRRSSAAG